MVGCNPSRTPVDTESKLGGGGTPVVDPTLYRSLAGSLQYLTFTRRDITYVVQQVCLYMHDPREPHFSALKQILRYVQGTLDYGLQLFSYTTDSLITYSDADWAGCPTTRRSTSGLIQLKIAIGSSTVQLAPRAADEVWHGEGQRGFLSPRGRGRGVKEKEKQDVATINNRDKATDRLRLKEASLTSVNTDLAKLSSLVSPTTANESNESTKGPILTKNTSGPILFATLFRSAQSRKAVNFRTLVALLVRSSYEKALVELRDDVELKATLVVTVPKFVPNTTPLATRTNGLERQKLDGKLMLVDDDGKPLKPHVDQVNADSDNEVDVMFSETASFMASMSSKVNKSSKSGSGVGNKSLYETWKETCKEPYDDDDFDDCYLIDAQMKFANTFDISLCGQLR
nr:ribonuclease H-like domain-containing protein [Tanacetum cinerariifolium]